MKNDALFPLLALSVSVSLGGAALGDQVTRLATEGAFPPYNYIDDDGNLAGFDIEVGDALCERAGLSCVWVTTDWNGIITNLVSGNFDAILAGMSITDERDEVIDFSIAYRPPDPSAFASIRNGVDLSSAVVAVQTGTTQASYVSEMGATVMELSTPDEAVSALRSGVADAVFANKAYLIPIVEDSAKIGFTGEDIQLGKGLGIGVRESDAALKQRFDEAIASMKQDGSLNVLIKKWLSDGYAF